MRLNRKIIDKDLCIGCGLCEAILGKANAEMQLQSNGFFIPVIKKSDREKEKVVLRICPGVNVLNDQRFGRNSRIWGKILDAYQSFSTDNEIRTKSSSGGFISGIAVYMLDNKLVDAVLHVGGDSNDYRRNSIKLSKTREDILSCAGSRYAPALVLKELIKFLKESNDSYLFIGKPCDISGLKNFLNEFPQYRDRFKFFVSIICAGIPSFNATQEVIDTFDHVKYPIRGLMYRGNGWPGYFSFTDALGKKRQMTYNDSWGRILGKKIHFRCKICPDGIGLQADIAVGDAWETKDGYPDFSEREGKSLVLIRNHNALNLFNKVTEDKKVVSDRISIERIKNMQPYQYKRREIVGVRILATIMGKGVLFNFRGLRLLENLMNNSLKNIVLNFYGTLKRIIFKK